jgi:hypothetical protein
VLEGSVRRVGDRVRITGQLIEADEGFHLWSESYDRELADVFAVQDEIARAIVTALESELDLGANTDLARASVTRDPRAHDLYLLGLRDLVPPRRRLAARGAGAVPRGDPPRPGLRSGARRPGPDLRGPPHVR